MKTISVIGLGYIGLPTATILANHGCKVFGVDCSTHVVEMLNNRQIHIKEPGLETQVLQAMASGNLEIYIAPKVADTYIIAVQTPVTQDKKVDLFYVQSAVESVIPLLKANDLIIIESTCPPGTCQNIIAPMLEQAGWILGEDVHLAYCPERILPGQLLRELIDNNRIVGGMHPASAVMGAEVYRHFCKGTIQLTDATTAEMVKVMENTYRDVNIALANEVLLMSDALQINAWEVIAMANHHPRVNIHLPGPGVGGHCIPVDPWFLVEQFPDQTRLIAQARQVNSAMPHYLFQKLLQVLEDIASPRVCILGVAYKADVDDIRESPIVELIQMMKAHPDIELSVWDPYVHLGEYSANSLEEALSGADCVLLGTNHRELVNLQPERLASCVRTKRVLDTRNVWNKMQWEAAGFDFSLLGDGTSSSSSVTSAESSFQPI